MRPPVAGTRFTQTRTFIASGSDPLARRVEQRRGADRRHRDRVALAEVLDRELRAEDRLFWRQVRHQDVFADRGTGTGAGHVGTAALRVDERLARPGEDRPPPPPFTPLPPPG